ncbi:MAG: porin [Alphaproteobacteria bacterium]|nr:MAG: porin [Alphaproteobacteria bacterium]
MHKTSLWHLAVICLPVSLLGLEAQAQDVSALKADLARAGVDAGVSVTQISQGIVSGDGDRDWQTGGKVDATLRFDGAAFGLWSGLSVSVHQEWVYGEDVNAQGDGSLLPVNAMMGFPRLGGSDSETSIVVTQSFSDRLSVSAGKFNMLDAASRTPLLGGGGTSTFSHLGFAGPITGITPPYLLGVMGTLRTDTVIATVMIYDPRNAQDFEVIEDPFTDGVTVSLSTTFPVSLGGRPGFQAIRGVYSTQRGLNLNDIPQLALPPEAEAVAGEKSGRWYMAYSFQQYLFQQAQDPTRGWGVFGQFAISDGNPNTIESSVLVGIGGDSPLAQRPRDRWGIGYFRYNLSGALLDGLDAVGIDNLREEQGVEAFYNVALTGNLRLTGNLNYIAPGESARRNAVFAGLRLQASF